MKRFDVRRFIIATSFVSIATVAPAAAAVRCVNIGGTAGCYSSIQAAVNASSYLDTIQVAAGTYNEKVSIPNQWITIQGAGAEKTIVDGTGVGPATAPVFTFTNNPNPGPTVEISDLTIRGGYRGVYAGRFVNLTLSRLVIRDNGIGSGAGVLNNASVVTIVDSIIRDNTADDPFFGCDGSGGAGGGIASLCGGGSYNVINSAIVNNSARGGAGAVFVDGRQTIINSTFSGNHTTQANSIASAIMGFAELIISNSTFANNSTAPGGGAVGLFGLAQIKASIFDNNTGGNCFAPNPAGWYTSSGYSLSSDDSCAPALIGPGDLNNTSANVALLADNGGNTLTHALPSGSPALDYVPASLCPAPARDQRGVARPQEGGCDSGAFERVVTIPDRFAALAALVANAAPGGSLATIVRSANAAYARNDFYAACNLLAGMAREVQAQSGKKITPAQATTILSAIAQLRTALGC